MTISIATLNDINEIRSFINNEWKEDHILARDESFFRYEHQNNNQVNFVIAKNEINKIVGLLGFIPTALNEKSDVCTVIWKVIKNQNSQMLGIDLLHYLKKEKSVKTILSVGINKKTIGIYKYLGMYTNTLKQYVMINRKISVFKIGKINNLSISTKVECILKNGYNVKRITKDSDLHDFKFEQFKENIPNKNEQYFTKRYFQHPIYQYKIFGVYHLDRLVSIFVTRIQTHEDAKILRIVDFIGDENGILFFGKFLSELIEKEGFEYADFYCFGIDHSALENAGFQSVDQSQEDIIIPNYFAPYSQKNIAINFFVDSSKINSIRLFKADGDQDRPS